MMINLNMNDRIIELRRLAAEYYQRAAWKDNSQKNNYEIAEKFAQLSFQDRLQATEYANLADEKLKIIAQLEQEET
ncbi:MAG: hypothetical protein B7Z19_07175 [Polynucleobacter sp. 32-46-5]|nr:MAG: hypothetical protein B7Z19_07175 [Polynucleobacter sp. 32-46-5]